MIPPKFYCLKFTEVWFVVSIKAITLFWTSVFCIPLFVIFVENVRKHQVFTFIECCFWPIPKNLWCSAFGVKHAHFLFYKTVEKSLGSFHRIWREWQAIQIHFSFFLLIFYSLQITKLVLCFDSCVLIILRQTCLLFSPSTA